MVAGEPIIGVYPSDDGRKPSFPNPTANLVSAKKAHSSASKFRKGSIVSICGNFNGMSISVFVLLSFRRRHFCFGAELCVPSHKRKVIQMKNKFKFGMFLVTIGIVYGDIGTSPMYVMKSILEGNGGIAHVNEQFIVGALSLVIWTITLLTTIKYVLIAMKADNHGEGGIFSLYSLV